MGSEPAWMEGVRERDAMFGTPTGQPTKYEDTVTWAGVSMSCANAPRDRPWEHAIYHVPGFLSHAIEVYAERDGWQRKGNRMICPKCVAGGQ